MDRKLAKFFGQYAEIVAEAYDIERLPIEDSNIVLESDLKPIFDEIFSVDPITGNPRGDIAYFLSKDGNPQVKAFIESALFSQRSDDSLRDPEKFSDDLIVEYSRKDNESVKDYASRLASYRDEAIKSYEKYKYQLDNPNPE